VIHQAEALAWLRENPASPDMSVITSLPDVSEVGLELDAWKTWFIDAARAVLRWVEPSGVALFYQSDIKHHGEWIDKGYLIQRAIELEPNIALIAHKIVCRSPPGTIAIGRPSYSHLIAARKRPPPAPPGQHLKLPLKPGPDVLPDAGHAPWSRAMGSIACRVAIDFVKECAPDTKVIVDPFCGRGTVLAVANTMDLDAIGIDISAKRCKAARALIVGSARIAGVTRIVDDEASPTADASDAADAFTRGAELFDEGAYFDAHEVWEERWRVETNAAERLFLQGLIQVAAALHKREVMGSPEVAARVLTRAREKLDQSPANIREGFNLEQFRAKLKTLATAIESKSAIQLPRMLTEDE